MRDIQLRLPSVSDLRNALTNRTALAETIGRTIPDGWPEKQDMMIYAADQVEGHRADAAWLVYFFHTSDGELVGSGGFHGAPSNRTVEVGYEIAPAFRRQGWGTAAVAALVELAFDSGAVDTVIAQTTTDIADPSAKLLQRLGFCDFGSVPDPYDPSQFVRQWQRDKPKSEALPTELTAR